MADDVRADPIRPLPIAPAPLRDVSSVSARLPTPLTSFVDRVREKAVITALLRRDDVRLVTLIGPAGVGKTRLAVKVAQSLETSFDDGIAFIPLAAVKEPDLAPVRMAQILGIRDDGQPAAIRLQTALRDQRLLVLLDNFEQVLDAAPLLTDLLGACPELRFLVTSRARLNLSGERAVAVPPLELPDPDAPTAPERLLESAAVRLFVERAQAADAEFALSAANAVAVATICRRLDGLPLAIELAAARSASLPPPELLAGLTARLQVLSSGPRDAPARLRAMRDAVAWSDDLLTGTERALFRRLSVFAGGFTLEAAAFVAAENPSSAATPDFDLIGSLVDKSLIHRLTTKPGGSLRFGMLETIREFAQDRLEASGDAEETRRRHADYFLLLAEAAEARRADLAAADSVPLGAERDNLRAALRWLAEHGEIERMLRLAGALWPLWLEQGGIGPGRAQLTEYLAMPDVRAARRAWAKAASVAGALAQAQGDHQQASALSEQALAIAREVGDDRCAGMASTTLGLAAMIEGDFDRATALLEAGLASFRAAGDARVLWTLRHLGSLAFFQRDLPKAVRLAEEGLAIARAAGHGLDTARLLHNLGRALVVQGQCRQAVEIWREAVVLFREAGDSWGVADALVSLGRAAFEQGDLDAADRQFADSLALFREIGDPEGTALALLGLAWLAQARGAEAKATARFHDVLALLSDRSTRPQAIHALLGLGAVAFDHGDLPGAAARWRDALQRAQARDDRLLIASGLERFARLAAAAGWHRHGARLLAVAGSLRIELGAPVAPSEAEIQERLVSSLMNALGPEEFAAASAGVTAGPAESDRHAAHDVAGRQIGAEIEVTTALREAAAAAEAVIAPEPERRPPPSLPLSTRERDVLRLLAEGRTDREIAAALSLSYRTVTTHVTSILSKLDVDSRTAAAVFAVRSGLV